MLSLTLVQKICVWSIPVLLAITLHEAAHAFVAYRCGDNTAKMFGRLSLNPLRHIDLIGTLVVPILIALLSQFHFIFGWAKPVPINWSLLKKPRRDSALVAAAGPLSNIIMALLWATSLKISTFFHPDSSTVFYFLLLASQAGVLINLVLALLNLIPIPPLDGSRIVASLLSPRQALQYMKIERFGFLILVAMLFTGALNWLLMPPLYWALQSIYAIFNL